MTPACRTSHHSGSVIHRIGLDGVPLLRAVAPRVYPLMQSQFAPSGRVLRSALDSDAGRAPNASARPVSVALTAQFHRARVQRTGYRVEVALPVLNDDMPHQAVLKYGVLKQDRDGQARILDLRQVHG